MMVARPDEFAGKTNIIIRPLAIYDPLGDVEVDSTGGDMRRIAWMAANARTQAAIG